MQNHDKYEVHHTETKHSSIEIIPCQEGKYSGCLNMNQRIWRTRMLELPGLGK